MIIVITPDQRCLKFTTLSKAAKYLKYNYIHLRRYYKFSDMPIKLREHIIYKVSYKFISY